MKKLALLAVLGLSLLSLNWGPITHLEIAEGVMVKVGSSEAFRAGSVLPDMALCSGGGSAEQNWLHSQGFVATLQSLVNTPERQELVNGWKSAHVAADVVESAYSATRISQGAPWAADWAVDGLIIQYWHPNPVWLSMDVERMLVDAWKLNPCPGSTWQLTTFTLRYVVEPNFNGYLAGLYVLVIPPVDQAALWYGDYQTYTQASIDAAIAALGSTTATPTPMPTATWVYPTRPPMITRTPIPTQSPSVTPTITPVPPGVTPAPTIAYPYPWYIPPWYR